MAKREKNQGSSQPKRRLSKVAHIIIVVVLAVFVLPWVYNIIFGIAIHSTLHIDTSVVRKEFAKSAFAKTSYFTMIEDKSKAEEDRIFLKVDGIDEDTFYYCYTYTIGRRCWFRVKTGDGESVSLGRYYWDLHEDEIAKILKKYDGVLEEWRDINDAIMVRVYNNDTKVAMSFVKDLLKIPDMHRLYLAYQETVVQVDHIADAYLTFGNFDLDCYEGGLGSSKVGSENIFVWAEKHGL